MGNTKVTFKDYIQEKLVDMKPLRDQKRKLNDEINKFND